MAPSTGEWRSAAVFALVATTGLATSVTIHAVAQVPAPVARTGQTVPYAAGDDGDLQKGVAFPDPRFTDNLDGTVTDRLTGLVWLKDTTRFSGRGWNPALAACNNLADDGADLTDGSLPGDWRLPNSKELRRLIDFSNSNPALPTGHPFVVPASGVFWSSTTATNNMGRAWTIEDGEMVNDPKGTANLVWCVRDFFAGGVGPAPVPKTGQLTPYGDRDDGELQAGVAWPDPRFTDNFDGTVSDNLTGLTWLRDAQRFVGLTFADALSACNALAEDGMDLTDGSAAGDWRLPNIWELGSLTDFNEIGPALPLGHPFLVANGADFWSSTTTATNANRAWTLGVGIGRILSAAKGQTFDAWPVRGETPNRPPVADAGADDDSECGSPSGASVTLDGSASTDPDSAFGTNDDIQLFEWFDNYGQPSQVALGAGETLDVTLSLGVHVVTLRVTDTAGNTDTDTVVQTVVDTVPPEISVELIPDTLWPPNHRMVDVQAAVTATDACSVPQVVLTSVVSSEADNGQGDGNTTDDIQGADLGAADFRLELRAERAGGGSGRIYTAAYTATDGSSLSTSASGFAFVPHDQGGITDPIALVLEQGADGTLVSWSDTPAVHSYDVIRGDLAEVAAAGVVISLGAVTCIENDSADESTLGGEDPELPVPGQAYFYLVEYFDGTSSSYGTESADRPRAPASGDCE